MVNFKRTITIITLMFFIITMIPGMVFAKTNEFQHSEVEMTLEKAIHIAKENFTIPKELEDFTSSYTQQGGVPVWHLQWRSGQERTGEISVGINSITGEITAFHCYDPAEQEQSAHSYSYLPKITREEASKKAADYIEKLTNRTIKDFQAIPVYQEIPVRKGAKYYDFNYVALINNTPYSQYRLNMTLNADTGALRSFYYNWDNQLTFPNQRNYDLAYATNLLTEKLKVELNYFKAYGAEPVQLVYQVKNPQQLLVDAATGQLISIQEEHQLYKEEMAADSQKNIASRQLTPQEKQEVEKMSKLLSRDEAIKSAVEKFPSAENYQLEYANLFRDGQFPQLILWQLNWEHYSEQQHSGLGVEINAATGEIISYNHHRYQPDREPIKKEDYQIKDREAALEFANSFLAANYPAYKGKLTVQLPENDHDDKEEREPQSNYWFTFTRMVDGIPFPQNYFNINIDAVNGEVASFKLHWADVDFPAAEKIVELESMKAKFINDSGVKLTYVKEPKSYQRSEKVYLVYGFDKWKTTMFDAYIGTGLDHGGKPLQSSEDVVYTDIKGHWAEADIKLLQQLNILPIEGPQFKPEEPITEDQLMKMLTKINQPWLEKLEDRGSHKEVSREELAVILVKFVNYYPVSQLDIFKLPLTDKEEISREGMGAVAITTGFNWLSVNESGAFEPKRIVTRAEAATVVVRLLKTTVF